MLKDAVLLYNLDFIIIILSFVKGDLFNSLFHEGLSFIGNTAVLRLRLLSNGHFSGFWDHGLNFSPAVKEAVAVAQVQCI